MTPGDSRADHDRPRYRLAYLLMVGVPLGAAVALMAVAARGGQPRTPTPPGSSPPLDRVLIAIMVIVVLAQAAGWLATRLRQPRVVAQMVLGVLLGPSFLGALAPEVRRWLLPQESTTWLTPLAQLGVMFFMFLIGRELASIDVGKRRRGVLVIGHAMIAVPFVLGVALALVLLGRFRPAGASSLAFVLFVALATSVTALPVLAHILAERGMLRTHLGWLGICSAAVGDATAWCLLALTLAIARNAPVTGALVAVAAGIVLAALMWWWVRPWLHRWAAKAPATAPSSMAPVVLLACVVSAGLFTDWIGLHAIFGAFLVGLVCPSSPVVDAAVTRVEAIVDWLLLPLYFISVGMRTKLGLLISGEGLLLCLAVVVVAVAGKIVGTAGTARLLTMDWPDSLSLGAMMNCRGLTELVVLGVGLSAGIINEQLYSTFVVMTILTTALTGPLLSLIERWRSARDGSGGDGGQVDAVGDRYLQAAS